MSELNSQICIIEKRIIEKQLLTMEKSKAPHHAQQ
jgi:hypothetical protein